MRSGWRCDTCGDVAPFHVAEHIGPQIVESVLRLPVVGGSAPPLWCPWPLPPGWTVTGVGWAGDERDGVRATALACSGPDPLHEGPADLLLVAEEPGVGLGPRFGGLPGPDCGDPVAEAKAAGRAAFDAKIRIGSHHLPLWAVPCPPDRSAYVSEARGLWLYAVAWPSSAGYLLAEHVALRDLSDGALPDLVYGAPSPYLHGRV